MKSVNAWGYKGEADKAPYHYKACGLDDVYLVSGYDVHKTPYGEGVSIKDMDKLHVAIGRYLVCQKKDFSGKELRFLRKEMDLSQSELGGLIGLTSQQVARWEKEESVISGPADVLVRALFLAHTGELIDVRKLAEELKELDTTAANEACFQNTGEGWKLAVNQ